jgi:hypothetical protein
VGYNIQVAIDTKHKLIVEMGLLKQQGDPGRNAQAASFARSRV